MKGMAQGRGMPRSVQILRTNSSLISLCRGMALRLLSSGWCHQEWLPPSLNRVQPCWLRWRNKSRRFTEPVLAPRRSCLQHHLQRSHQSFTRGLLGIHARHFFHPADPPVAVLIHNSGVGAHRRSLNWIKNIASSLISTPGRCSHENPAHRRCRPAGPGGCGRP